jgi:arylsulfatase A-like enzyme
MIRAPRRRRRRGWPTRALLLACGLLACGRPGADDRPSFLVVLSDDHRFDALGAAQRDQGADARFPWLATPNLDRLAAEGVRFRNAFVVNALCSPSRASFLTGRYPHEHGVVDNDTPLDPAATTYASLLRAAGYRTGYAGKWHMGQQSERPGFDWWASYVGQGTYFDATFDVAGSPRPATGWVDDATTDFAIEFLRQSRSAPFLLVVGYKAPHGPRKPASLPERGRDRYRDVEIAPARNGDALAPYAAPRARKPPAGTGRRARVYFDLVSAMDDALGRLLDELDALGIADRTFVAFAGDNGYMLGEHGMVSKRSAYEASIRIPLLVRWPALGAGARGRSVDAPVLNLDLAPTLLELAGVGAPGGLRGRSLRPLLAGEAVAWRRSFLYEYFAEPGFGVPTHLALRDVDAKLVVYPGHPEWTQLFDLAADPGETRDLANDPSRADRLRALRAELEREARALGLDPAR